MDSTTTSTNREKKRQHPKKIKETPKRKMVTATKKVVPKKPKDAFSCTLSNSETWMNIFKSLNFFVDTAALKVDKEGITLYGDNSSNTGMYELKMPKNFFSSYTCDKPTEYNINLNEFCNVLTFLGKKTSLLMYSKIQQEGEEDNNNDNTSGKHAIMFEATSKKESEISKLIIFVSPSDSMDELKGDLNAGILASVSMKSLEFKTLCKNIRYDTESAPTHTDFGQKKPKSAPKVRKGFTELHMLMKKDRLELSAKMFMYNFKITYHSEEPEDYIPPSDDTPKKVPIVSYEVFKEQCDGKYSMDYLYKISQSSLLAKETTLSIFDNGLLCIMFMIEGDSSSSINKDSDNNSSGEPSYSFLKFYIAPIGGDDDQDEDVFYDGDLDELMYEPDDEVCTN